MATKKPQDLEAEDGCCESVLKMKMENAADLQFSLYRLGRMEKMLKGDLCPGKVGGEMLRVPKFIKKIYGPNRYAQVKKDLKNWIKGNRYPKIIDMLKNEKELIESWLDVLKNPASQGIDNSGMLEAVRKMVTETQDCLTAALEDLKIDQ